MNRMLETSARLLRLLSLLQSRRDWRGAELAGRLGVGLRTVRRDIDRLRDLGYPVDASPGAAGGYRLGTGGAAVPPLLLDDEEAVAVAISLHSAATGSVAGLEETALRALTKLQAMLPSRLRHKIMAFHATTLPLTGSSPAAVDPELLTSVAAACRDQRQLRLRYQGRSGVTTRNVEPHRLVHTTHRWYLLAWDTGRGDWRTFRLDRIEGPLGLPGARFTPARRRRMTWPPTCRSPSPPPPTATRPVSSSTPRSRRSPGVRPPRPPAGSHRPARLRAAHRVRLPRGTALYTASRASISRSSTRPSSSLCCAPWPGASAGPPTPPDRGRPAAGPACGGAPGPGPRWPR